MDRKKNLFLRCVFIYAMFFYPLTFAFPGENLTGSSLQQTPHQQGGIIKGKVTDENGEPVIGATVRCQDTNEGTITDVDGNYILKFNKQPNAIVISFLGYKEQQIRYKGDASLNFILQEDTKLLDEVVVTGYQTISKERATGSFSILSGKLLNEKISLDASSAIQGNVPGVSVYGKDADGKTQIVIRGRSTLSTNVTTNPLIVIDGMPTEQDIDNINMNDVESFTFLKDAASASVYGVRAANGVIVITTKKGAIGKTQINFIADWKIEENPSLKDFHYASTSAYIDNELNYLNFRAANTGGSELNYLSGARSGIPATSANNGTWFSPLLELRYQLLKGNVTQDQYDTQLADYRQNNYRQEYMDNVWRNPFRQSYNLSISNASEKQNTYISFNYTGNALQLKPDKDDVLKAYIKNIQNINKWLTVEVGIDARYTSTTRLSSARNTNYATAEQFSDIDPYMRILNPDGSKYYQPWTYLGYNSTFFMPTPGGTRLNPQIIEDLAAIPAFDSFGFNILDELGNTTKGNNLEVRSYAKATLRLLKGLTFTPSFEYEASKYSEEELMASNSYMLRYMRNLYISQEGTAFKKNVPDGDRLYQMDRNRSHYTFRSQVDYKTMIAKDHDISLVGGFEMQQTETYTPMERTLYGFDSDAQTSVNLNNLDLSNSTTAPISYMRNARLGGSSTAFANKKLSGGYPNRFVSLYAIGGYSYKNLYNLSGSIRVDQASITTLDPKYRYRPLWSVGAGWNISNEDFMKDVNWLDRLALRTSYGITGNVDLKSSPYVVVGIGTNSRYIDTSPTNYYVSSTAPNPLLRWEKTTSYGAGLDFSLFKNKLSGRIDGYYKFSDDLLVPNTLSTSTGYLSATINNGSMSNKGVELMLTSPWFKTKDWTLTSTIVYSYNTNRIESVGSEPTNAGQLMSQTGLSYYKEGKPRYSLYSYHSEGLSSGGNDFQNGVPIIKLKDGTPVATVAENGTITVMPNNSIPVDEAIYQGSLEPIWSGSFTQNIKFRNWELTSAFTYFGGHKVRKPVYDFSRTPSASPADYLWEDFERAWTPQNTNTDVPKAYYNYSPLASVTNVTTIANYWRYSDANVVDADLIRLSNLALSYTLTQKLCKTLRLQNLKLTAQGNNLWYWCAAGNGIDSETISVSTSSPSWVLPKQPSFLMRFELTF